MAILAPASEPGPLWSEKLPAMSLSTPIVMDGGSDCARKSVMAQANTQAAEMTTRIVMNLPVAETLSLAC
jgi:hypothetical protein